MRILNCHQNTEPSDFIGEFRPKRNEATEIKENLKHYSSLILKNHFDHKNLKIKNLFHFLNSKFDTNYEEIMLKVEEKIQSTTKIFEFYNLLKEIRQMTNEENFNKSDQPNNFQEEIVLENLIEKLITESRKMFEWKDGILLKAMKEGDIILFDEISLAEHSVIERLNSVLEDKRRILVPEISEGEEIGFNFKINQFRSKTFVLSYCDNE